MPVQRFNNMESEYQAWADANPDGFIFNHFCGNQAGFNLLHKCTCPFLWREKDEGRRTVVQKWCSESKDELTALANETRGPNGWKHCGFCFRSLDLENLNHTVGKPSRPQPDISTTIATFQFDVEGEAAVFVGSGVNEWKEKVRNLLSAETVGKTIQWIDLEFAFKPERILTKDIDNLATPVLEAARDASLIARGFNQLGTVTARKIDTTGEPGLRLQLFDGVPRTLVQREGVSLTTALPSLLESAVKWAIYDEAFRMASEDPKLRFSPGTEMYMHVVVSVSDNSRRKSIMALLKPCIDGMEPIMGTTDGRPSLPRSEITGSLAPQDEMILELDFRVRGGTTNSVNIVLGPLVK